MRDYAMSSVFGIKQVSDEILLVNFMDYDPGFFI